MDMRKWWQEEGREQTGHGLDTNKSESEMPHSLEVRKAQRSARAKDRARMP